MMVKQGDSPINDAERTIITKHHPQIHIEDTPTFYDMEVFNRCVQAGNILSSIECWKDIHLALVTIPMADNGAIPYGLLYAANPRDEILNIVIAIKKITEQKEINTN